MQKTSSLEFGVQEVDEVGAALPYFLCYLLAPLDAVLGVAVKK